MSDTQSKQRRGAKAPPANGSAAERPPRKTPAQLLGEAVTHEQAIATEAADIRQRARNLTGQPELTLELLDELLPLLRRPIPQGFLVTTPPVKGKPYESTGIKSLQVQVDRMNNVLRPWWWEWETLYANDGRVAHVIVFVGPKQHPLVRREARGGIDRASTEGNLYKGSETNAAKLAIARVGPGHEVYVGATDYDPDVSPEAAEQQQHATGQAFATVAAPQRLNAEQIRRVEKGVADAGLTGDLPMKLRALGLESLSEATTEHATVLYEWVHSADAKGGQDG